MINIAHFGWTSVNIFVVIGELCVGLLQGRITPFKGIEDDDEFWKLAAQLSSGVADIHDANIIHLALQVRR